MKKAEKTKKLIIEKSAQLFNRRGYAGTSMQDIAKEAGVTKGSIYGHNFKDKEEIALAAFDYNLQKLFGELWKGMDQEPSAKGKLVFYCEFHRKHYKKILAYGGCPVLNSAIDSDDTHEKLNQKVRNTLQNWEVTLSGVIQLGIAQKEFKKEVDAVYYANLFISLIEGSIMLAKTRKNGIYILNALQHIEHLLQTIDINH
ncbi:MAG TPA: TetR/AcrR family transcriptional regulator [Microscillaceae bacterium]|nr:TetR/AcrR family transcriptional regulator [Microscillaceae bacterium]